MRLEFEPNISAIPLIENGVFDDIRVSPDPSVLLKKGISAAQAGDRTLGRELLTQAVDADPCSTDALMWLASISEYPEELLAFLDRVLAIEPANEKAVKWHAATRSVLAKTFAQRGIDAYNNGDADGAGHSFDQAIDNDETCESAWLWKSRLADSDERRVEFLTRVVSINPDNHDARSALDAINASSIEAWFADARTAAAAGDNTTAIAKLDTLIAEHPHHIDSYILRAHLASDLNEKLSSLSKALEIEPDHPVARATYDFLATPLEGVRKFERDMPNDYEESAGTAEQSDIADPFATIVGEPLVHKTETDENILITEQPDSMRAREVDETQLTREMLAPVEELIDADDDTVESLPVSELFEEYAELPSNHLGNGHVDLADVLDDQERPPVPCPYCGEGNDANAFECGSCRATLTVSDIERLLDNDSVDVESVRTAVTRMEAEWNLREFSAKELVALAIGHFNLRNYSNGIKYLQEASLLTPNDVILSAQINSLVIRLDEIRRRNEANETRPTGRTILVVDDNSTVRKLISGKLEKSGHVVLCAKDGAEALERIAESVPDLVLLDITMPDMDGYEVCRQVRANPASYDIPVVMISGKDGFFDKVRGRMAGTTAYITKPFGPETLMKALESYLVNGNRPENEGFSSLNNS